MTDRSTEPDSGPEADDDPDADTPITSVSSPADLTGIAIEIAKAMTALEGRGVDGIRLGVDSLSTLLLFLDLKRVLRFTYLLCGRVESRELLGVYSLNASSHEARELSAFAPAGHAPGRRRRPRPNPGSGRGWRVRWRQYAVTSASP